MKQKVMLALALSFTCLLGCSGLARAESSVIVPLEGAPLKVLSYVAEFDTKDDKPRIEHAIKYQNVTDKKVVAARFGVLEYNAYGDRLDSFVGYTLEDSNKGEKDSAEFVNPTSSALFFKKLGEAYVWVDAVRYADGSLWKADRAQLLEAVKKFKPETSEADLAEKQSLVAD